jgi:DNA modification methylase
MHDIPDYSRGDAMSFKEKFENKIVCGNCAELMKEMPDECVDLTVTSPPYGSLRDYDGYSFNFDDIARQLYRVTKPGGIVVWVVADQTINGSKSGESFRQALEFKDNIGFRLHDVMFYHKNVSSFPCSNRYMSVVEYMFVLSKGKPKTFNPLMDRPNLWGGQSRGIRTVRGKDGVLRETERTPSSAENGMRTNVWYYVIGKGFGSEDDFSYLHPATFSEKMAEDHIKSWSNPNDIVLDPMVGSGTTAKMALRNGRRFVGIDVSENYVKIAEARVLKELKRIQRKEAV